MSDRNTAAAGAPAGVVVVGCSSAAAGGDSVLAAAAAAAAAGWRTVSITGHVSPSSGRWLVKAWWMGRFGLGVGSEQRNQKKNEHK